MKPHFKFWILGTRQGLPTIFHITPIPIFPSIPSSAIIHTIINPCSIPFLFYSIHTPILVPLFQASSPKFCHFFPFLISSRNMLMSPGPLVAPFPIVKILMNFMLSSPLSHPAPERLLVAVHFSQPRQRDQCTSDHSVLGLCNPSLCSS